MVRSGLGTICDGIETSGSWRREIERNGRERKIEDREKEKERNGASDRLKISQREREEM